MVFMEVLQVVLVDELEKVLAGDSNDFEDKPTQITWNVSTD